MSAISWSSLCRGEATRHASLVAKLIESGGIRLSLLQMPARSPTQLTTRRPRGSGGAAPAGRDPSCGEQAWADSKFCQAAGWPRPRCCTALPVIGKLQPTDNQPAIASFYSAPVAGVALPEVVQRLALVLGPVEVMPLLLDNWHVPARGGGIDITQGPQRTAQIDCSQPGGWLTAGRAVLGSGTRDNSPCRTCCKGKRASGVQGCDKMRAQSPGASHYSVGGGYPSRKMRAATHS